MTDLKLLASALDSQQVEIDLARIATIESSNNPKADSFRGAKFGRGLHQVSEIALQEYNQRRKESLTPEELYDPETNTKVADWYVQRIGQALSFWGIPQTEETLLASYNWGMGNVRRWYKEGADPKKLPKETRDYIKKYRNLAQGDK